MLRIVLATLLCASSAFAGEAPCKTEYLAQHDGFGIDRDGDVLHVYKVEKCGKPLAEIKIEGRFAFASILQVKNGMPTISIDTWLMHGDRLRRRFVWSKTRYVQAGGDEMVPGPKKRP